MTLGDTWMAGDLVQEMIGGYVFRDESNGIVCTIELDGLKPLPSDAFVGSIERVNAEGEAVSTVCTVEGSWLGYLDFDGQRYAPTRHLRFPPHMCECASHSTLQCLPCIHLPAHLSRSSKAARSRVSPARAAKLVFT